MRPPAMLAKTSATLDILTKGRVELGLGTGSFWDAIHAYGGPRRSPSEAVAAYEEALQVIHLIWNYGKGRTRVSFPGKYYQLENAQAGPSPHHQMSIWTGAFGPGMMRLIGRLTDGWVIPLTTYMSRDEIRSRQKMIDASARKYNRSADSIKRIANIVGAIDQEGRLEKSNGDKAPLVGSVSYWTDWITSSYKDLGVDTFIFWPTLQGQENEQTRIFAEQVVPKARSQLKTETKTG
jgi:alkanesulfonate monooxygenase SsuD/methylene tetrahydromethanopterin reductase-like flavin-dependent oxidoreductase (luciferase family)